MGGFSWKELFEDYEERHVGLRVRFGPAQRQLDYSFDSLASALRIMLLLAMVSEGQQIRVCSECSTPFVPKDKSKSKPEEK